MGLSLLENDKVVKRVVCSWLAWSKLVRCCGVLRLTDAMTDALTWKERKRRGGGKAVLQKSVS